MTIQDVTMQQLPLTDGDSASQKDKIARKNRPNDNKDHASRGNRLYDKEHRIMIQVKGFSVFDVLSRIGRES